MVGGSITTETSVRKFQRYKEFKLYENVQQRYHTFGLVKYVSCFSPYLVCPPTNVERILIPIHSEPFESIPEPTQPPRRGLRALPTNPKPVSSTSTISQRSFHPVPDQESPPSRHHSRSLEDEETSNESEVDKLTRMLNDTSVSDAKKYAIKKEIRMIKAREIQRQRKLNE